MLEIHQSTLSLASRCGLALEHYLRGIKKPPAVAMVVGTVTHRSAADDLREHMRTGLLRPDDEIEDAAAQAFDDEWGGSEPALSSDEKARGESVVRGEAKDDSIRLAVAHHRLLAPTIAPVAVEEELRAKIAGEEIVLVGTLDVREQTHVRDLKTKSRKPALGDAEASHQFDMYALLVQTNYGTKPRGHWLDVLVRGRRAVSATSIEVHSAESFAPLLFYVERVARMIQAGVFLPVDATGPSAWVCSERFCGYYEECPMGRARRKVFQQVIDR